MLIKDSLMKNVMRIDAGIQAHVQWFLRLRMAIEIGSLLRKLSLDLIMKLEELKRYEAADECL